MKKLKLTGLLILILSLSAFGQQANVKDKEEWKLLSENNYSVQYPQNWELNQSGQMGTKFFLFSALSSSDDKFRENVSLIIQDVAGMNIDLDKYAEISENQIRTLITEGTIQENMRETLNGLSFQKTVYTFKQGVFKFKVEQFYWVEKEKAYVLTFTCEENQFDIFKETGEKILKSFKLDLGQ